MIDWVDLCERQLGENSCFQLQQKRLGRRDIVMHLQRLLCESVSPASSCFHKFEGFNPFVFFGAWPS